MRLMRLLDEESFPNTKAIVREQVAPFLIRTEKREAVDNEGNPLFKKRHTQVMEIEWLARHELQRQLYEEVTEYVRNGYNKAIREKRNYIGFLMILFQRMVSSSTVAIIDATQRRLQVLQNEADQLHSGNFSELVEGDTEESLKNALTLLSTGIKDEIKQLSALLSLAKQASLECRDTSAPSWIFVADILSHTALALKSMQLLSAIRFEMRLPMKKGRSPMDCYSTATKAVSTPRKNTSP